MLSVQVQYDLLVLIPKTSIIQSKLMVMSKMMLPVQQNFVLKNDLLLLSLFRVTLLVHEKWGGMAQHG